VKTHIQEKGWLVTCSFQKYEKTYPVTAKSYYKARVTALYLFLQEFSIPGRPWEFVTSKKGVISYTVRSTSRRKGISESTFSEDYYLQTLIDKLTPGQKKKVHKMTA
jgi:hypothetical protein